MSVGLLNSATVIRTDGSKTLMTGAGQFQIGRFPVVRPLLPAIANGEQAERLPPSASRSTGWPRRSVYAKNGHSTRRASLLTAASIPDVPQQEANDEIAPFFISK